MTAESINRSMMRIMAARRMADALRAVELAAKFQAEIETMDKVQPVGDSSGPRLDQGGSGDQTAGNVGAAKRQHDRALADQRASADGLARRAMASASGGVPGKMGK